ncbi:hypothetical protein C0J52_20635 [Blattella germanica]|nr:hypothetical protein C0J52_20635 [Blattella germanica]
MIIKTIRKENKDRKRNNSNSHLSKIHFPWKEKCLWKIVKDVGRVKKTFNCKDRYSQLVGEGHAVIYLNESCIDSGLTFQKCWQHDIVGIQTNIIYCACRREKSFHSRCKTSILKRLCYRRLSGQMNSANYEKWVNELLLSNVPPNAVFVFNNASYHSVKEYKVPTPYALKQDMLTCLNWNWLVNWDIDQVTVENWIEFCNHVEKLENCYWKRDGIVPDVIDQIVINMNGEIDSDSATIKSSDEFD